MSRKLAVALVVGLAAAADGQVVLPPNLGVPDAAPTVPGPGHELTLSALASGDYAAAIEIAGREYQGSARVGAQRWIDSIATAALLGECHFERGEYREAVARYGEAMALAATHRDWLLAVQFPPQPLRPSARPRVATWGRSRRNASPAAIPDTMTIRQQGGDPQDVLQRGGVLTAPYDRPIRPQEIVRALVISLYRQSDLLGELARDDATIDALTRALARRPAPPNHYSQAWIDVALGAAYWAQGKPDQAQPLLTRGLSIGNGMDHPLTAWSLIVLGRIALAADQAPQAATLFEEATFIAADYGDARALEEAFQLAWMAHRFAGGRGVPPSLSLAADWSRRSGGSLRARLLAINAEAALAAGDGRAAAAALADIDGRLLKGDAGRGWLGAQVGYVRALAAYAAGDIGAGDADLATALGVAQSRSARLFRTGLLLDLVRAGSRAVSDRQAEAWFATWLGEPSARDWSLDPLGTLAVVSAQRSEAFDAWMMVAGRCGQERLIEAAEATMRNRWLASQPCGGRRVAIDRFLAADPRELSPAEAAQRAAVVASQPGLADLLVRTERLRGELAAAMVAAVPADGGLLTTVPGAAAAWEELAELGARRRQLVAALAAGRQATPAPFPPLTPAAEIRRRLGPGQRLLSFHWSSSGLFAALESADRTVAWQVRQAGGLPREIETLARELGMFNAARPVAAERLASGDWAGSLARIERMLFENARGVWLADGTEELVVVPDGWLWYVPFELMPVASNRADADRRPLAEACRVRYSPTRSLAVLRFEPRAAGPLGIVAGRIDRQDDAGETAAGIARLTAGVERAVAFQSPASGPAAAVTGSVFDSLVLYDELPFVSTEPRPLLVAAGGRAGLTMADWLAPPLKRPRLVVLPGMQTAMASGLSKPPARPGEEMFFTVTDLFAAGATTALVSRWRMGGGTCQDLLDEFLREVTADGGLRPAEAWQRAVDLSRPEPPDLRREPRVGPGGVPFADASHPIFWAGYLLADCGMGRYDEPQPAGPPPLPPLAQPAAPQPAVPGGPMPPPILAPEPAAPRVDEPPAAPPRPPAPPAGPAPPAILAPPPAQPPAAPAPDPFGPPAGQPAPGAGPPP